MKCKRLPAVVHIDEEEFYRLLEGVVIEDVGGFNAKLQEWETYYNYHRPHSAFRAPFGW